jgi:hypothetical protein
MSKLRVPPFIPLAGSDRRQKGMWLNEFAINERRLAKKLSRWMV